MIEQGQYEKCVALERENEALRPSGRLWLWCGLALALAMLFVSVAHAQTTRKLVSNIGVSSAGTITTVGGSSGRNQAQQFTTGAHTAGYVLSSVEILLHGFNSGAGDAVAVSLRRNGLSNTPGTSLGVLTNPTNIGNGRKTFTAPAGTTLKPNTAYHILVAAPTGGFNIHIHGTNAEDDDSASGWSLRDSRWSSTGGGVWNGAPESLRIQINGYPILAAKLVSSGAVEMRSGLLEHRVDLKLSEAITTTPKALRNHAFTLTNGTIRWAQRIHYDRVWHDDQWVAVSKHFRLRIKPTDPANAITVTLPIPASCSEQGAVCTEEEAQLASAPELTLGEDGSGPITVTIEDTSAPENNMIEGYDIPQINFPVTLSRPSPKWILVDFEVLSTGTATSGVDYYPQDFTIYFVPGKTTVNAGVALIPDTETDAGETFNVRISNARMTTNNGERTLTITTATATGTIHDPSTKRVVLPDSPQLAQNAPNPFNSQTVIAYALSQPELVRLEIFSLTGQRVAVLQQGLQQAGYHQLRWQGRDDAGRPVATGIYLYRLVTEKESLTRKLILLK